MRVAIIAALPGELKPLVRGWRRVSTGSKTMRQWVRDGGDEWVAVCAGMGVEAARRAFVVAANGGRLDRVLSVGWAGALHEEMVGGRSYVASAVIDARTGERFELSGGARACTLVSTARVAQQAEKQRLAATYGAAMVDMEAAAVVRLAQMRGIAVCCIKAVSDEVGAALPDLNRFVGLDGHMRLLSFLRYVAVRPKHWRSLLRLGRTSAAAARALAVAVQTVLDGPKDFDAINRTGLIETGDVN